MILSSTFQRDKCILGKTSIIYRLIIMKKYSFLLILLLISVSSRAQETFTNNLITNTSGHTYGTARYVGMGGAMGALGADISTMSFNPAGIALYRRADVALTAGAIWNSKGSDFYSNTHATFDQIGGVFAMPTNSKKGSFVLGFNYQKKINFNNAFEITGATLPGLSQMDQMAEMTNANLFTDMNLCGLAYNPYGDEDSYLTPYLNDKDEINYFNKYSGTSYNYRQRTWGSLQGFDIDFAYNSGDRFYFGFDLGFDNIDYRAENLYTELSERQDVDLLTGETVTSYGDYSLNNDVKISGWGINFKLGAIVRPFADNSFRLGVAIESPTWYSMQNSTIFSLYDEVLRCGTLDYESFLRYRLTTPWRVRASMGSTVSNWFAWDIDYEYAHQPSLSQSYGTDSYNRNDPAMTQHMSENLSGVHLLKAGIEVKPSNAVALRVGYNYASSPYQKKVSLDQYAIESIATDFLTQTSYCRLGNSNTITLGMGYKWKHAYVDLAYKLRAQHGDFYAFDTNFTNSSNEAFHTHVGDYTGRTVVSNVIEPQDVNLTTHQISATIGYRF